MKLQFGILYRDERVADRQDLDTLLGDYATWDAETSGQHFDGPLLMGYRGDKITFEEDSETQPFSLGPYTITFDGRLDNREDIAAKIGITANQNLPDPTLILQAYEKYGDSLLPDLIGEFALVIWRSDRQELRFVRSTDGARPLYYHDKQECLVWSSSLVRLISSSGVSCQINEEYILQYLVNDPISASTPFLRLQSVPAGQVLVLSRTEAYASHSLWQPEEVQPIRYRCDKDYEEAFAHMLKAAVRARLRAKQAIFCELSGGLDSSSIALLGDEVLRETNRDTHDLRTLSTVYDESYTSDERFFIHTVEKKRGIATIYIQEAEQDFTVGFKNLCFRAIPNNFDITPGRFPAFIKQMKMAGSRVLLTGVGGDHVCCSWLPPEVLVAQLLTQYKLIAAHRCCATWSRLTGTPYLRLLFGNSMALAISSILPQWFQYDVLTLPEWLTIEKKRIPAELSIIIQDTSLSPGQRFRIGMLGSLFRTISTGAWNVYDEIFVSHPFSHRPLVEFCLACSISQFVRNGETRSLLRRSLREFLPPQIVSRKAKGRIYEPLARATQREWAQLGDAKTWELCRRGYADAKKLNQSLMKLRMGIDDKFHSPLRGLILERFLRSLSQFPSRKVAKFSRERVGVA